MLGTRDTFDYVLAQDLGMPLHAVRELPNAEVMEWRAYYKYRHAMDDLEARSAR